MMMMSAPVGYRKVVRAFFDTSNSMNRGRKIFGFGIPRKQLAKMAHDVALKIFPAQDWEWEYFTFSLSAARKESYEMVLQDYEAPKKTSGKNTAIYNVWHNEKILIEKMENEIRVVIIFTDGEDNRSAASFRKMYENFLPKGAFPIFVSFGSSDTVLSDALFFDGSNPADDGDSPANFYSRFMEFCEAQIDFSRLLGQQNLAWSPMTRTFIPSKYRSDDSDDECTISITNTSSESEYSCTTD